MNLNLSDEQMNAIVTRAIFETISEEQKTQLLEGAIKSLLEKANPENYYDKRTKLQVALDGAVAKQCSKVADEFVSEPANAERIRSLLSEAFEQAFVGDGRKLMIQRVAQALRDSLRAP